MFKDYQECREFIESFIPLVYGKEELGLTRIENLLSKLKNPEKKFKSIHVGGTSGKGSVCFYLSNLLAQKNLKVGLHISPHLVDIRERMQIVSKKQKARFASEAMRVISNKLISVNRFVGLVNRIKPVVDDIKSKQPQITPSYFEILVAMSFLYFAEEKVDIGVVEVGLGGRLDATNVLDPQLSIITNVGLDHTEILGNTVEKIAKEKAGIIKKNVPVITGASGKALKVIENFAKEKNARVFTISTQKSNDSRKNDIEKYTNLYRRLFRQDPYYVTLECFLTCMLALEVLGIRLNENEILMSFEKQFPGRFEQLVENVVVDGAHNGEKAKVLTDWYKEKSRDKKTTLVVAFKNGKNWKEIVDILVAKLNVQRVIATEYQSVTDTGKGSAVDADEIAQYVKKVYGPASQARCGELQTTNYKNSHEAVVEAMSTDQLVLVTGSLYLVGEARTLWQLPSFT